MQKEVTGVIILLVVSSIVLFSLQQGIPLTGKAVDDAVFDQDDINEQLQYEEAQIPIEEQSEEEIVTPPSEPAQFQLPQQFTLRDTFAPRGASLEGENDVTYNQQTGIYRLIYRDSAGVIRAQYEIDASTRETRAGLITIKESITNSYPVYFGGISYRRLNGNILNPWAFGIESGARITFQHMLFPNKILRFSFQETLDGITTTKAYDYQVKGKTLILRVYSTSARVSANGNYQSITLTPTGSTPNPRQFIIPYMEQVPLIVVDNRYFISNYFDWSKSNFNYMPQNTNWNGNPASQTSIYNGYIPFYVADQSGNIPQLDETAYVTVSDNVYEVMMNIHKEPPPFRAQLYNIIPIELDSMYQWMTIRGMRGLSPFANAKKLLDIFYQFGMRNLWVNLHDWHFGGPENTLPTHHPPNIEYGGSIDLKQVSQTANSYGYLLGLYVGFRDMYDGSAYWNPDDIALNPDGTWRETWRSPFGRTAYLIKPDKMKHYASRNAPYMDEDYGPTALFIDMTTTMQFYDLLDYSANAHQDARTIKGVFSLSRELNDYLRNTIGGPIEGESTVHPLLPGTYYAGSIDAAERELLGRECGKVLPDFEINVVRPLTAGFGMGLYPRWPNCNMPFGFVYTDPNQWVYTLADKYRATAIAYGHTGFFYDQGFFFEHAIPCTPTDCSFPNKFLKMILREYFLMKTLQWQYLQADVIQIRYKNPAGNFVDLNEALKSNLDFSGPQLYLEYNTGLRIYVNRHPANNLIVTVEGTRYTLPPSSYIAWNPNLKGYNDYGIFLTYSALVNGRRVDYINSPFYLMADGRGALTNFGNIQTSYFKAFTKEVMPELTITEDASGAFNNFQWPKSPIGWFSFFQSPLRIQGWAFDPNTPSQPVTVKFYIDGPKETGEYIGSATANLPGSSPPPGYPAGNYGFEAPVLGTYSNDRKPHAVYSYVVDTEENTEVKTSYTDVEFINVPTTPDTTPPVVALSYPAHGSISNPGTVFFAAQAQDNVFLKSATLYTSLQGYYNRNSQWTPVQKVILTPHRDASVLFVMHDLPDNAQFQWNIEVCDFANNCAFAPANRDLRLQYADEPPSVALFKPVNNERLASNVVTFVGYAASRIPLAGAMLYAIIDNREVPLLVNTDISGKFAKIEFTIPVQIPLGAYEWNIRACNRNDQCASAPQNFRMTVCGASC